MKGKLLYLLIWGVTSYVGVLYYSPSLLGLAALEFLLPLCSFLMLWWVSRKIRGNLYLPIAVTDKNQKVQVGIEIINDSWIPVPGITVTVTVVNKFYGKKEQVIFRGMAGGKKTTRILADISSNQCGPLYLEIQQMQISDLFHLFQKKIPGKGKEILAVMPDIYQACVSLQADTRDFLAESEEYDKQKPGDDPSEVFQIREYRGGDRLQSIHWKLSARTDDLMVREYSLPINCAIVFFIDMEYQPEEGYGNLDEFIEAGIAISLGILEEGKEHYVVWYDRNSQDLERLEMKDKDDIYVLIERLFASGPYPDSVAMEEIYREKFRGETWQTQLLWNMRKELWKNGNLESELSGEAREILENGEFLI